MFKSSLLFLTLALSAFNTSAQEELKGKYITQYLFAAFTDGTVLQKSGEVHNAKLNYNTLTDEVVFQQDGRQLALANPADVVKVTIGSRTFIPVENMFYELATNTSVPLCIQRHSEIVPLGNETGFGKSQTTSITNINDLKSSGMAYTLTLPDDFKIVTKTTFWLKRGDKYKVIKNGNDVKNEFLDKVPQIDSYLKKNKVNFKSADDVIKLIEFCNNE